MIFGVLNPQKIWHQQLVHLPISPAYCCHFTLENPKSQFPTVLFIHTSHYFRYFRGKVMLRSSKHLFVALTRTGCDVWQLECQASYVTASVQSNHLQHGYMFPVFFVTDQLHSPPRSGEIQPMSQQDASTTRPYCGFVLDTRAVAACPKRGNLPGCGQDCWLATCQDWLTGHGAEARLCHEHDVLAHCLAGRQTRLQQCCGSLVAASASATRLGNTASWFLLQPQWRWAWYSWVWIL